MPARRGGAGLDGQPRAAWSCIRIPVRADDLEHPDELRVDLDPVPGRRVAAAPGGRPRGARGAGRPRPRRLAQDVGLARHPRQRPHPSALVVRPGAARRAGAGPRGRAARARDRHQQVVEGGAPRRLPRLQPERQGPHGRERLLGAPQARRARLRAGDLGRARRAAGPRTSRCARCRRASPRIGDRHAGIDEHPCSLDAAAGAVGAAGGRGPGRRAVAAALREAGGRAAARRSRRKRAKNPTGRRVSTKPLLEIARAARRRTTRWPGSSAGRRGIPRPPRTSRRRTCWWTRCAAARPPGPACA